MIHSRSIDNISKAKTWILLTPNVSHSTPQACFVPWQITDFSGISLWSEVKWSEVAQSCPTLCDPVDCSLPGFSVHGILQARVLEWVAISFSRGSSQHRDWTQVSRIAGRRFNLWATSLGRHITLTHVKFLTTKPPVMSQDFLNPDAFFRHYNVKEISK